MEHVCASSWRTVFYCSFLLSGKRTSRGLYTSKDGIVINADINGACNIIRKAYPDAFDNVKDLSYLYTTTIAFKQKDLFRYTRKPCSGIKCAKRPGPASRIAHREHLAKKHELMGVFDVTKKTFIPAVKKAA